jgi:hypothetical protein
LVDHARLVGCDALSVEDEQRGLSVVISSQLETEGEYKRPFTALRV